VYKRSVLVHGAPSLILPLVSFFVSIQALDSALLPSGVVKHIASAASAAGDSRAVSIGASGSDPFLSPNQISAAKRKREEEQVATEASVMDAHAAGDVAKKAPRASVAEASAGSAEVVVRDTQTWLAQGR
jgi:hypothetical protein